MLLAGMISCSAVENWPDDDTPEPEIKTYRIELTPPEATFEGWESGENVTIDVNINLTCWKGGTQLECEAGAL